MKRLNILVLALAGVLPLTAETWRPLGNATVVDGWITPFYVDDNDDQIDPKTCPFDVPVEESVERPGVYKLVNPFGGSDFHLADFNVDGTAADIIIDTRDRRMVVIEAQYCGFTDADPSEPSGYYKYYLSDMGTYMKNLGQDPDVIRLLGCASTMTGNIINIPQPTVGTSADKAIQASDPSFPAMIVIPDAEDDSDNWTSLGKATVIDGWLTPIFKDDNTGAYYTATDHPIQCEVMQNKLNPARYCLVSPYTSSTFHLHMYNLNVRDTRIEFDMTDRDFVLMEPQFSGYIARLENGAMQPYYIADGGTYMLSHGYTREQVIEQNYNSFYRDGVLNIVAPVFTLEPDGSAKIAQQPQVALIYFDAAGVDNIVVDRYDCEPEYFDLQGIRVAEPVHGRIYLCRKGMKVDKIVY